MPRGVGSRPPHFAPCPLCRRARAQSEALGGDRVIDYTTSVVTDEVDDAGVVLELAGGDTTIQMLKALREGGLLLTAPDAGVANKVPFGSTVRPPAPDDEECAEIGSTERNKVEPRSNRRPIVKGSPPLHPFKRSVRRL